MEIGSIEASLLTSIILYFIYGYHDDIM